MEAEKEDLRYLMANNIPQLMDSLLRALLETKPSEVPNFIATWALEACVHPAALANQISLMRKGLSSVSFSQEQAKTVQEEAHLLNEEALRLVPKGDEEVGVSAKLLSAQDKLRRVSASFNDVPTTTNEGKPYACFSLNECTPPISAKLLEEAGECLTYIMDFTKGDVCVAHAERALGSLAAVCANITGIPFSLANWYPAGLSGDILVKQQEGPAGKGAVYLNSIERGLKIIFLGDVLWNGFDAAELADAVQAAGAIPIAALYIGECTDMKGRAYLNRKFRGMEVKSLVKFSTQGPRTQVDSSNVVELTIGDSFQRKVNLLEAAFVGVPIQESASGYPYVKFPVTDFSPLMDSELVEAMAECCVARGNFSDSNLIVASADRGGGFLAYACAKRTGLAFCLSTSPWGVSQRLGPRNTIPGLRKGHKVIVVCDMLSSGSSQEGLFRDIINCGAEVVGAVFVSEKVNMRGKQRLQKAFPQVNLVSLCRFVAEPADKAIKFTGPRLTEKFKDLNLTEGTAPSTEEEETVAAPRRRDPSRHNSESGKAPTPGENNVIDWGSDSEEEETA